MEPPQTPPYSLTPPNRAAIGPAICGSDPQIDPKNVNFFNEKARRPAKINPIFSIENN